MRRQLVRIGPKVKRIHLQRFLLSKFSFFLDEVEMRDLCCLFENQLWLEKKCQTDPDFAKKFSRDLESLSIILKQINFRTETSNRALRRFSLRIRKELPDLILPKRNYMEARKNLNGTFTLEDSKSIGISSKRVPPKSYIGKGYRDKGSARNVAKDGSPSWQEVATHRGPIYHKGKRYEESTEISRAAKFLEVYESLIRKPKEKA